MELKILKSKEETCFYCGKVLSVKEIDFNIENAVYCCNGLECGCMGMPINPPICFECVDNKEVDNG